MTNHDTSCEEMKAAFLDFVSSEVTSHASTVVGISILEFTYLTSTRAFLEPFSLDLTKINLFLASTWQYWGLFCVFWILNFALIYSVGRYVYYGNYANTVIVFSPQANDAKQLKDIISQKVKEHPGVKWIALFRDGLSWRGGGVWFSFLVGLGVSIVLFLLFFYR